MDLSVNVDIPTLVTPDQKAIEWENWGEERSLDVYEVQVRFDGFLLCGYFVFLPRLDPDEIFSSFCQSYIHGRFSESIVN